MKKTLFLGLIIQTLLIGASQAQTFNHDFETSKKLAEQDSKPIVMIFSGSDWCKPCIQLKKNIISDETFVAYSDESLVLLEVDFPFRRKNRLSKEQQAHNDSLAEKYNPKGIFPLIVVLDKEGNVQQSMGYNNEYSPEDYIKLLEAI